MRDTYDEHEHVAIFWDYENCTPPCNVPGYDVVNNIRQVAHEYGSVKLFKAYLELSEQSSSKSIGLRSELQSCGVSLTDCPHNGRKDVADKMMIVDMLTYAIDNPAPATIVLISGDRDFVYAVSVLRLRRYRVVVVAPYTAHASLRSQASVVLDWEADIMRRTTMRGLAPETYYQAPPVDPVCRSPRRAPLSLAGPLPQATPKGLRRPSFRAAASAPAAGPDGGNGPAAGAPFQGRHSRNASAFTVGGPPHFEGPSTTDRFAPTRAFAPHAAGTVSVDEDEEMTVKRPPIPDIVDVMEDIRERMSRDSPATCQLDIPDAVGSNAFQTPPTVIRPAGNNSTFAAYNTVKESDAIDVPDKATETLCTLSSPPDPPAPQAPQPLAFPFFGYEPPIPRATTVQPLQGVQSDGTPSAVQLSPPQTSNESSGVSSVTSSSAATDPSPLAADLAALPAYTPTPVPETLPLHLLPPPTSFPCAKSTTIEGVNAFAENQLEAMGLDRRTTPGAATRPAPSELSTSPDIPEQFRLLVDIMKDLKKHGMGSPHRSVVANRLMEVSRKTYTQAGMSSFKAYSVAAERAGIVTLGGLQGNAWISLRPEFCGAAAGPSAPQS
ncbi:DUF537-domain-containing protein [Trametes cingulata]|nr:DUF537-domain-containing protein [Trametes cingulata]